MSFNPEKKITMALPNLKLTAEDEAELVENEKDLKRGNRVDMPLEDTRDRIEKAPGLPQKKINDFLNNRQ